MNLSLITLFLEGKVEDLQVKFPSVDVQDAARNDPSQSNKYLDWMCRQLAMGGKKEDLYPTILYFHRNIQRFDKKDINAYKTLKDLEDTVKSLPTKSKAQQKKQVKQEGAPKIYEDQRVVVVRLDSKEACQIYGSGTKWCITMKDASYYEQYKMSNVVFYYVLRKEPRGDEFDKIAAAVQRGGNNQILNVDWFDSHDNSLHDVGAHGPQEKHGVANWGTIVGKIEQDAVKQPKAFLARLKSEEKVSVEEFRDYWKSIQGESTEVKYTFVSIVVEQDRDDLLASIAEDLIQYEHDYSDLRRWGLQYLDDRREIQKWIETAELGIKNSRSKHDSFDDLGSLANNKNLAETQVLKLFQIFDESDEKGFGTIAGTRSSLLANPAIPESILKKCIDSNDTLEFPIIARNPALSLDLSMKMLDSFDEYHYRAGIGVPLSLAMNSRHPEVLLRVWHDYRVRPAVSNKNFPPEKFREVIRDFVLNNQQTDGHRSEYPSSSEWLNFGETVGFQRFWSAFSDDELKRFLEYVGPKRFYSLEYRIEDELERRARINESSISHLLKRFILHELMNVDVNSTPVGSTPLSSKTITDRDGDELDDEGHGVTRNLRGKLN